MIRAINYFNKQGNACSSVGLNGNPKRRLRFERSAAVTTWFSTNLPKNAISRAIGMNIKSFMLVKRSRCQDHHLHLSLRQKNTNKLKLQIAHLPESKWTSWFNDTTSHLHSALTCVGTQHSLFGSNPNQFRSA